MRTTDTEVIEKVKLKSSDIKKYDKFTVQKLIQKAQKAFNEFIRLRDNMNGYFTCISCGEVKKVEGVQLQAGHFYKTSIDSSLRFDERNVNGQCNRCNVYLSGNEANYIIGLKQKIGLREVLRLEETKLYYKANIRKWHRLDLITIIIWYQGRVKQLKNTI